MKIVTHPTFSIFSLNIALATICAFNCAHASNIISNDNDWTLDVKGIYLFNSSVNTIPAMGIITGPSGTNTPPPGINLNSNDIHQNRLDLNGWGIDLNILKSLTNNWFSGIDYQGHFVDDRNTLGNRNTGSRSVHANLLNRSLADSNNLNQSFISGIADYASDSIDVNRHSLDFIIGKQLPAHPRVNVMWKAGLRGAYSKVDRKVQYQYNQTSPVDENNITGIDTAKIHLDTKMLGVGPILGAGTNIAFGNDFFININGLLAGTLSYFKDYRLESNFNSNTQTTAYANVWNNSYGAVAMAEFNIDLTKNFNQDWAFGTGYIASSWLGAAHIISQAGWDDVHDITTSYHTKHDDILTQGVYIRLVYHPQDNTMMKK